MGEYAARRGSARLPIKASVRVRFPGVDEPYEGTVRDLGMSGMFIAGNAPMPAGTLMHFEFRPSEQWHMLRGRGRVVWARQRANAGGEPPGMGVRFIELDERGRRGVRWLIETYQSVGDKPFETWSVPSQFTRSLPEPGDALDTQEVEPVAPQTAESAPPRRKAPWAPIAAVLVVLLGLGWLVLSRGGAREEPRPAAPAPAAQAAAAVATKAAARETEDPAAGGAAPPTATPTPVATTPPADNAPPAAAAAPPAASPPAGGEARPAAGASPVGAILTSLVDEWAAAWSSQDIDRYLAFYAPDFVPGEGQSRAAWARQRAERLERPAFIRVTTDSVQVLDGASDAPRTVFTQTYESDTFSDQVTKSLTWVRSEGSWRIVSEQSAP